MKRARLHQLGCGRFSLIQLVYLMAWRRNKCDNLRKRIQEISDKTLIYISFINILGGGNRVYVRLIVFNGI